MNLDDVSLYEPSARDMMNEYPELAEHPEFAELKSTELKLTWYVGNRTSPFVRAQLNAKERIEAAVSIIYSEAARSRNDIKELLEGIIPPHLLKAIQKWAVFNPSYRLRAKLMSEYIFDELQSMVYITEEERTLMRVDPDLKKKHTDLIIKVNSELPSIIKTIESGYGIAPKKDKKVKKGAVQVAVKDIKERLKNR